MSYPLKVEYEKGRNKHKVTQTDWQMTHRKQHQENKWPEHITNAEANLCS